MTENFENSELCKDNFDKYKRGSWDVIILDRCASTIDIAKQRIENGADAGTMIISHVQTGGRGRQSRKWQSPSGGIWMGIILKPKLEFNKISSITLLCAVAVTQSIEQIYPVAPKIKWPNDIYIKDKKVCGILTETVLKDGRTEYVIAGIGINANNSTEKFDAEIKNTSISFRDLGIYVQREQLASLINDKLQSLLKQYEEQDDLSFILDYYTKRMQWLNEEAVIKNTVTNEVYKRGVIQGIGKLGQLIMDTQDGTEKIISGELSLRPL